MRGLPRMASICGDLSGCPVLRIELSCFLMRRHVKVSAFGGKNGHSEVRRQCQLMTRSGRRLRKYTRYRDAHIDRNEVPNNFGVNEPSLSTQGIGCSCGG
jgi:hypothetical protein